MNNTITVIVPVYKIREGYLRKCIESLINQGREDYQIILVDDGSPDNCGVICDEYSATSDNIMVIHEVNQGVSMARNHGIEMVNSRWLTFVDADDWVEPFYINSLYSVLDSKASDADIVLFNYVREYKKSQSKETLGVKEGFLGSEDLNVVQQAPFYKLIQNGKFNPYTSIGLWDKVYRTDFLKENDIYFIPEARKGQDRLFNADALNSTTRIFYFNSILYHYRCWGESRTNRYDPNIVNLTKIEIKELQRQIIKHNLNSIVGEYMDCRICTRLYSCMRLYFFNDLNSEKYHERINSIKMLIKNEPFKSALRKVNMKLLSWDEKIFVFFVKMRFYGIIYIMVKIRSRNKDKMLS